MDLRRLAGLEARWALPAAGVAVVAARAVAPDAACHLVAQVPAALAELLPEGGDLTGRGVELAAVVGRVGLDGAPEVGGIPPLVIVSFRSPVVLRRRGRRPRGS